MERRVIDMRRENRCVLLRGDMRKGCWTMAALGRDLRMTRAVRAIGSFLICVVAVQIDPRAFAQDADLPAPVKAALDEREAYCTSEKKPLKLGTNAIRKLDLSGEGHVDYILDDSAVSCGDEFGWCGSGGCSAAIFMQTAKGYTKVFDDLGGGLKITRRGKGYMVVISQRGGAGARLVFDNGCAVNLAKGKSRSCKAEE